MINNRKFKYRVWDKKLKTFKSDSGSYFVETGGQLTKQKAIVGGHDYNDELCYISHMSYPLVLDKYIVQQFTGLKDKNGIEIYEGDICNFGHTISKLEGIGQVYWNEQGMYFAARTKLPFLLHTAASIEVIGNIFENPNLLNNNASSINS